MSKGHLHCDGSPREEGMADGLPTGEGGLRGLDLGDSARRSLSEMLPTPMLLHQSLRRDPAESGSPREDATSRLRAETAAAGCASASG